MKERAPRILQITTVHDAGDGRILHKECHTLAQAGYHVILLAHGSLPAQVDSVEFRTLGPKLSRPARLSRGLFAALRASLRLKADIYHFHDSELIAVGLLLKCFGKKVVYDVHEDLPRQVMRKSYLPGWSRGALSTICEIVEWVAGKSFDGIVAATPKIAERFPSHKTVVARNYVRLDEAAAPVHHDYEDRPNVLGYMGVVNEHRSILEAARAMRSVPKDLAATFQVIGRCSPQAYENEILRECSDGRVVLAGWMERSRLREAMSAFRIGLSLLKPEHGYEDAIATKMFEYMLEGIPMIVSDQKINREVIETAGCGLIVDPYDSDSIAGAITWLFNHPDEAAAMGRHGRESLASRYNWATEGEALRKLYVKLLSKDGAKRHERSKR